MTFIEICRKIVSEHQAHVIRERKGEPNQYDCKPWGEGKRGGWLLIDGFSASAVVKVYDALNDDNKAKFLKLKPLVAVNVSFKFIK